MSTRRLFENGLTPMSNSSLANANIAAKTPAIGSLRRHLLYQRYGLQDNPFGVTPNPRYTYQSRTHAEAQSSLVVGIECGVGFQALIAPPGMGKTMILRQLLERFDRVARTAFLFQTQGDSRDFFSYLLAELGSDPDHGDVVRAQAALNQLLLSEFRSQRQTIVAVDEAQNLPPSILETLRQLSNFETTGEKLLQIVLAGQPQLAERLADPALAQLRQRISIFATLAPFDLKETAHYIEHRLKVAGFEGSPLFSAEAIRLIWEYSRGVPRTINVLCFTALLLAAPTQQAQIDHNIVREVLEDRDLETIRCRPEDMPAFIRSHIGSPEVGLPQHQWQTENDPGKSMLADGPRQELGSSRVADRENGTTQEPYSTLWPIATAEPEVVTAGQAPDSTVEPSVPLAAEHVPPSDSAPALTPLALEASVSPREEPAVPVALERAPLHIQPSAAARVQIRVRPIGTFAAHNAHWMALVAGVLAVAVLVIISGEHSPPERLMKQVPPIDTTRPALESTSPAGTTNHPALASAVIPPRRGAKKATLPRRRFGPAGRQPSALVVRISAQPTVRPSGAVAMPDPPPMPLILGDREDSDPPYLASIFAGPTLMPSERAIRISQGTHGGELIRKTLPIYPSWAKEQRVEGDVVLQAVIDKQGRPRAVKFVSGVQDFAAAAIIAVKHWRYRPLYVNGQVVEWNTTVVLKFQLP